MTFLPVNYVVIIYLLNISQYFHTVSTKSIKFIGLGDWGKGGNSGNILYSNEKDNDIYFSDNDDIPITHATSSNTYYTYQAPLAKAMGQYAANSNPKPSFIVALGDNFYTEGVSSTTDSLW